MDTQSRIIFLHLPVEKSALLFGFPDAGLYFLADAFFQQENVEGTYRIPLKYTHIPEDVVFDHPLPEYIEISVTGNGSEIFSLDFRKKDSLEINVTELTKDGTTELQGDKYLQLIRSQLSPNHQSQRILSHEHLTGHLQTGA